MSVLPPLPARQKGSSGRSWLGRLSCWSLKRYDQDVSGQNVVDEGR
jgi:hypothetical protein